MEARTDPEASRPASGASAALATFDSESVLTASAQSLPFRARLGAFLHDSVIGSLLLVKNPKAVLPFSVRPGDLTDDVRGIVNAEVRRRFPNGGSVELRSHDVPAVSGDHSEDPFAPLTPAGVLGFEYRVDREFTKVLARDSDGVRSGKYRAAIRIRSGDWFRPLPEGAFSTEQSFPFLAYLRQLPEGAFSTEQSFPFLAYLRQHSQRRAVSFTGGTSSAGSLPAPASADVQHLRDFLAQLSPQELPDDPLLDAAFWGKNFKLEPVTDFSTLKSRQKLVVRVDGDAVNHLVDQSFKPTLNPLRMLDRAVGFGQYARPPHDRSSSYRCELPLGVIRGQDPPSAKPQIVLTQVEFMDDGVASLKRPRSGMISLRDLSLHVPSSGAGAPSLRYVYMDPHLIRYASSGTMHQFPTFTYEIEAPQFEVYRVEYRPQVTPGVVGG